MVLEKLTILHFFKPTDISLPNVNVDHMTDTQDGLKTATQYRMM